MLFFLFNFNNLVERIHCVDMRGLLWSQRCRRCIIRESGWNKYTEQRKPGMTFMRANMLLRLFIPQE